MGLGIGLGLGLGSASAGRAVGWADVGEMQGRCTGDVREMYGRCGPTSSGRSGLSVDSCAASMSTTWVELGVGVGGRGEG